MPLVSFNMSSLEESKAVVRGRCVLSYVAVQMMKMKTTVVADYLNVSQPTVSKSLLIGEGIVKKNPGMVDLILTKA